MLANSARGRRLEAGTEVARRGRRSTLGTEVEAGDGGRRVGTAVDEMRVGVTLRGGLSHAA